MKQNYATPITEAIDLRLENNLLSGSYISSSSDMKRPDDCPCNRCPYKH